MAAILRFDLDETLVVEERVIVLAELPGVLDMQDAPTGEGQPAVLEGLESPGSVNGSPGVWAIGARMRVVVT